MKKITMFTFIVLFVGFINDIFADTCPQLQNIRWNGQQWVAPGGWASESGASFDGSITSFSFVFALPNPDGGYAIQFCEYGLTGGTKTYIDMQNIAYNHVALDHPNYWDANACYYGISKCSFTVRQHSSK